MSAVRVLVGLLVVTMVSGCGPGELLSNLLEPGPQLPMETAAEKRAAFSQAYRWFGDGDCRQALPVFRRLVSRYPELGDYHLYFAGVCAARLESPREAQRLLARLLSEYPQSVEVPAARLELGTLLAGTGRVDDALPLLDAASYAADTSVARKARLAFGEAKARAGDVNAAQAAYMGVRREAVGTPLGRDAAQRVRALREQHPHLEPAGTDRLEEARLLLAEHEYVAAEAAALRLLQHPDGVDAAEATRVYADALYGQGRLEDAFTALWDLAEQFRGSPAAPAALFRLSSILWNRDRDAAALRIFNELLQRYPHDTRAPEALYAVGRIHQQAGRTAAAITAYADLAKSYPNSTLAPEAQWRIGWLHYRAGNWLAAAAVFAPLSRDGTSQRDAAAYWQARALERAWRPGAARQLYHRLTARAPDGYYALWAAHRLRGSPPTPLLSRRGAPLPPAPADGPPPPAADPFHLGRAAELRQTGLNELARAELAAVERAHDDVETLRYLVRAYQTVDGYHAAMRLAGRLGNDAGLSGAERERLRYPLAFWPAVQRLAEEQAVDPLLIVAVMRQESMFDPAARSPANAHGLMQLLPSTAEQVAAASTPPLDHARLTDPQVNITLGVRHLRALLARFGGDPLKALAAYNGGETAVEKWQRRFADLAPDEWVESITYRETRDYVKRVLASYRAYRRIYVGAAD
jgi:soluble lytic murein transglycosylase